MIITMSLSLPPDEQGRVMRTQAKIDTTILLSNKCGLRGALGVIAEALWEQLEYGTPASEDIH